MSKTAAIVIIGDEILSGRIEDCNSLFFSKELRKLGVSVKHIAVISDDTEEIAETLRRSSGKYDYVFTSGGIGPTHDDITIEGVAKAFNVNVVKDPELEKIILERYKDGAAEAAMKMAEIPEGAELIKDGDLGFPLIVFRNVFIFPGIPEYLKNKFEAIKETFREKPFYSRTLCVNQHESNIAHILGDAEKLFESVKIGSYPSVGKGTMRIKIVIESKDGEIVDKAFDYIKNLLDPNTIEGCE